MSTTATRLEETARGTRRRAGDVAGSAALVVAILAFGVWALAAHPTQFVVGIVVGSVLALGALGLTLIYGVLKFANFAHGDTMMLSAYLAFFALSGGVAGARGADAHFPLSLDRLPGATNPIWKFSFGYGLLLAIVVACVVTALLHLGLDRVIYRRLRRRRAGLAIFAIVSLGVAIATRSLILMIWGPTPRFYVAGIRPTISLLGVRIPTDQLFIVAAAVVLAAAIYLLLFRTATGRMMRAMADNPDLARVSGIDTEDVVRRTWLVSGALIAVAGVLLALQSQLKPELGFLLLLPIFAAAVLGGLGSPQGALVGGLIVGVVQEVSVTFGVLGAGYKFAVAFVILILVILVRPRGLFGARP